MPSVMSLINAISLTPQARVLIERAIASVALQCGGSQAFFSGSNALQDYTTDVELLGHPLPVLTNPNQQQRSRTENVWPQTEDTLALPAGIVTFSNDDLCCPEPNHNRPLFVSVEHRNKLV